jgi:hypothetical protein
MERENVNELILQKVDEIEEDSNRRFVEAILRFERSNMDKEMPQYTRDFEDMLKEHFEPDGA